MPLLVLLLLLPESVTVVAVVPLGISVEFCMCRHSLVAVIVALAGPVVIGAKVFILYVVAVSSLLCIVVTHFF